MVVALSHGKTAKSLLDMAVSKGSSENVAELAGHGLRFRGLEITDFLSPVSTIGNEVLRLDRQLTG